MSIPTSKTKTMKTIIEDPFEANYNDHDKDSKPANTKFGIDEDIYNFIEEVQKISKSKTKHQSKPNFTKAEKQHSSIDKSKKKYLHDIHKGLSDNQSIDTEHKSKAQKGLLMLLNKMSGGTFINEIKLYFEKKNEELRSKNKERKEEGRNSYKRMSRQTPLFTKELYGMLPHEKEEIDANTIAHELKELDLKAEKPRKVERPGIVHNQKFYMEDSGKSLYQNLISFFSNKEAIEITEMRNNEEERRLLPSKHKSTKTKRKKTINN